MSTEADLPTSCYKLTGQGNQLTGSVNNGVIEETVTWYCPWQDSSQFFQAVVGYPETIPLGNGVSIVRKVPLRNPFNSNLFATGMSYESQDGARKGTNPYQHVLFKVKFSNSLGGSTSGFDGGGNQDPNNQVPLFSRISRQPAGRNITDTSRQYSYSKGGESQVKIKHDVGVYFAGGVFQIVLYRIPDIYAWQEIVAPLDNCVNSTPFKVGAFVRAPGTVLFDSYGFDEDTDVMGNRTWTGVVNINCSSLKWNNIFEGGQQYPVAPKFYPNEADLNVLYQ